MRVSTFLRASRTTPTVFRTLSTFLVLSSSPQLFFGSRGILSHALSTPAANGANTSSPPSSYDLLVIGGGSAGLTAAKFAATFGKSVALIESAKLGGDCTWTGCVPSKTLLAAAKSRRAQTLAQVNRSGGGSSSGPPFPSMSEVKERIDYNRQHIYEEDDGPEVLEALGISVVTGRATFRDAQTLEITNGSEGSTRLLSANDGIVIGTGASPRRPTGQIAGLDTVPYLTYEEVWEEYFVEENDVTGKRLTIVGGGPIGCELAQALSRLGSEVTIVAKSGLLPRGEPEASEEMERVFESEGIKVVRDSVVSVAPKDGQCHAVKLGSGESVEGDTLLVAAGRVPNTRNLGLEKLGVEINPRTHGIDVDIKLQTSVKGVYAAGDCTGDRQFTHYAGYQGAIAARNALLPLSDPGVLSDVPGTTFTDPEVATVGMTEKEAREKHGDDKVSVSFRRLSKVDRAICEGTDRFGFIKVVYHSRNYQILGACIAAPVAGEMISEVGVAMKGKVTFDQLATVMHTYPSYSIVLQQMAADVYYDKLKKSTKILNFLKKIGL